MKLRILAAVIIAIGNILPVAASQPCNNSHWVWQGGERVKVCCNQSGLCFTKYGIYSQQP